ncbi:MAG: ABC transporter ATP-binding protein [Eubacteriales bacterium]
MVIRSNAKLNSKSFILKAENISKSFSAHKAIENICFNIAEGEVIGMVGDNGTGKSTIMRIISLVDSLDTGKYTINGENVYDNVKYYRSLIGYIPQSDALIEEMTASDNLRLFSLLDKKETEIKINELTKAFDMGEFINKKVKHLSGGMKKRVNISAGLMNRCKMIVADEPFAGLDKTQREKVIEYFKTQSKNGVAQLITSHYVDNLKGWSKSIIEL